MTQDDLTTDGDAAALEPNPRIQSGFRALIAVAMVAPAIAPLLSESRIPFGTRGFPPGLGRSVGRMPGGPQAERAGLLEWVTPPAERP